MAPSPGKWLQRTASLGNNPYSRLGNLPWASDHLRALGKCELGEEKGGREISASTPPFSSPPTSHSPLPPQKKKKLTKKKNQTKKPQTEQKEKKKTTKINLPQILWSSVCPFQSLSHSEFHCKSSLIPTLASLSNPVPFQSSSVVTNALMSKCVWRQKSDNCGICKVSLIWTHLMLKWWSKAELLS